MSHEANSKLVVVRECWGEQEAGIVISFLAARGIEAVTSSTAGSDVLGITIDGLGKIQILVEKDKAEEAKELLDDQAEAPDTTDQAETTP